MLNHYHATCLFPRVGNFKPEPSPPPNSAKPPPPLPQLLLGPGGLPPGKGAPERAAALARLRAAYLWATAAVASYSFVLGDDQFQAMTPVWDVSAPGPAPAGRLGLWPRRPRAPSDEPTAEGARGHLF